MKELWLIDEDRRTVEVRVLKEERFEPSTELRDEDQAKSTVLAGFEFVVSQVFN